MLSVNSLITMYAKLDDARMVFGLMPHPDRRSSLGTL
jgi:phosphoribosylformylglycinamidine (FGAM) synthase-like amidotransferase family enzyme